MKSEGRPYTAALGIGESLEEYAARTGRTARAAYPDWHAAGVEASKAWQTPLFVQTSEGAYRSLSLGGGVLALDDEDVGRGKPRAGRDYVEFAP